MEENDMNDFKRYLIHFVSITVTIVTIFVIAMFLDDTASGDLEKKLLCSVIWYVISFLYSVPMAYIYSKSAKCHKYKIKLDSLNDELESDIILYCKRGNVKAINDTRKIYKMKNPYSAWLTNPVVVDFENIDGESFCFINMPNTYIKYFSKKYNCMEIE